jgi:hypothetical protein
MSEQETTTPAPEAAPADATTDAPAEVVVDAPADDVTTFDPEKALAKIRKQNAENAALRAAKKAAEDKAAANQADASEAPKLREQNMRLEVALELGLPMSLAKRLQGSTAEEMKADAEELLAQVAPKQPAKSARPVESLQTGTGHADTGTPAQLTRTDLIGMAPEAIEKARSEGQLNTLLGVK